MKKIDQKGANSEGDIVGGDKTTNQNINIAIQPTPSYLEEIISADAGSLIKLFEKLDEAVQIEFGDLHSQTQKADTEFSSRKLFSSLSMIDIPPEVALYIVLQLPEALRKSISDDRFDTGDIRLAVSHVISEMPILAFGDVSKVIASGKKKKDITKLKEKDPVALNDIWERKKTDWAKRYCRRFGDPNQPIKIIYLDGSDKPLNYKFLKKVLVPKLLDRLLDADFRNANNKLVTAGAINEMAEHLLKEFRRLGLYSLRFKTALLLAEELAIQPPHPWLVTPETRSSTILYDMERAEAHLNKLKSSVGDLDPDDWHRITEMVHHSCSAILGIYSGFMGHRYLHCLHILLQWLRIQERNIALWNFCELRFIDTDLIEIKSSKNDLYNFLQSIDVKIKSGNFSTVDETIHIADRLYEFVQKLYNRRENMIGLRLTLDDNDAIPFEKFLHAANECISAIFDNSKARDVFVPNTENVIGFYATLQFLGTPFAHKPPLSIFSVYDNVDKTNSFEERIEQTIDLLMGHRLAEIAFLIIRHPLTDSEKAILKRKNDTTDRTTEIFTLPYSCLTSAVKAKIPTEAFFDQVMDNMS